MSDVGGTQGPAATTAGIPSVKIIQDVPIVFADGIQSQSYGFGVAKMYLNRYDPDPRAREAPTEVVVAQVVMPIHNFIMSVALLEHRLKMMVADKAITQEQVDSARKYWIDNPTAGIKA
jgi:hypothetical protein